MGNILEHVERPDETIRKRIPFLNDNGYMLISISKVLKKDGKVTIIKENQIREKLQKHSVLAIKNIIDNKIDYIFKIQLSI